MDHTIGHSLDCAGMGYVFLVFKNRHGNKLTNYGLKPAFDGIAMIFTVLSLNIGVIRIKT